MNLHKSSVVAIRCDTFDLQEILQTFSALQTNFSVKYLGPPLAIKRLHQINFQPLEDKAAAKLAA